MRSSSLFVLSVAAIVAACSGSSSITSAGDGGVGSGGSGSGSGGGNDSGSGSGGGVGGGDGGSASNAAAHPAFPQLVDQGGPIMTAPKVVTVTFPSDNNAATFQSFGATVANNSWWDTVRQGYCTSAATCVGDGPPGTSVVISAAPAASYTDSQDPNGTSSLKAYIKSLIPSQIPTPDAETILVFYFPATTTISLDGATSCTQFGGYHNAITSGAVSYAYAIVNECPPQIPTPDAETILVFYFPATTTISLDGATSCTQFGGYHNAITSGAVSYAYAIVNECPPQMNSGLSTVEETTFAASHEIIEVATDPFQTATTLGFYLNFNDLSILPWNNIGGGEAADMCVDFLGLNQDSTTEGGFTVQRIWNNAAAAAGGDPCVPGSSAAYYNVAPETWLETLEVGGSATFAADAFSTGPVSGWSVIGYDVNATSATNLNPYLAIDITGGTGVTNGAKLSVNVTLKADPAGLANYTQTGGATGLLLSLNSATPSKATSGHVWPFLVTTPADASDAGLDGVDAAEDLPRHALAPRHPRVQITHAQWANLARLFPNLTLN